MRAPNSTISTTVMKRILSVLSRCAMFQILHQLFEDLPAMFVTLKLVEASASRRQQDRVAWPRILPRLRNGPVQRSGGNQPDSTVELPGYLLRRRSY